MNGEDVQTPFSKSPRRWDDLEYSAATRVSQGGENACPCEKQSYLALTGGEDDQTRFSGSPRRWRARE